MTQRSSVAHYRFTAKLGEGGMGEVWRATDSKLQREVAIKLLPETFAHDPDRMARFEREARVLAALNHPNIAAIYGVEEGALVMELVDGPTLADRVAQRPIPLEEVLAIAREMAEALEYAHERGIVHRDLKPDNIKLTPQGRVKLLDFGLAKAIEDEAAPASPVSSPTLTMRTTVAGVIMGTAAYMSPEQVRGAAVDKRADIWSFGVVLYELLTGCHLFRRETVSDTLAAVLTAELDWSVLPPDLPASMRRLLRRCLERDRRKRMPDIGVARLEIDDANERREGVSPPAPPRSSRLRWAIALMTMLLAIGAATLWRAPRPAERVLQPLVRLDVDLGPDVSLDSVGGPSVLLSPDGTRFAYVSRQRVYVRRLDQPNAVELPGTEGAQNAFFSSDGKWLAFFAHGRLNKISVDGGPPISLANAAIGPLVNGAWGEDGTILANLNVPSALFRVPASGGQLTPVPQPGKAGNSAHLWPQFLPGGKGVLWCGSGPVSGYSVDVLSLGDGKWKKILDGGSFARYLPSGHLVYLNSGNLLAVPFDLERLEARGAPVLVLQGVAYHRVGGGAQFDFSPNGTAVYRTGGEEIVSLQWLDSRGKTKALITPGGVYTRPRLSPDGAKLAVSVGETQRQDIYTYELKSGRETRLTFDRHYTGPIWTRDGRYIVASGNVSQAGMFWMRSDGGGTPQQVFGNSDHIQFPFSFTSDRMAYFEEYEGRKYHLWTVAVKTDAEGLHFGSPEPFRHTPGADERHPSFSPDGRWLAYAAGDTQTREIYVRAFPGTASSGRWQVSKNGGLYPMWSRNARQLFFRTEDNQVMVADCDVNGDTFVSYTPRLWSDTQLADIGPQANYDVTPDGNRVLAVLPVLPSGPNAPHHVVFLLNFFDELRRRVPVSSR